MAKRLFIVLELPETHRAALAALDPQLKHVRWARPEQMHLTLAFLGNVEPESEVALREALAEVRVPSFFLPLRSLGTFGRGKPSVIWAGVGNAHPHLFALHKHLQDAILRARLEPDLRPFHPHVTLARPRDVSAAALRPFLRQHAETDFGLWEAKAFHLLSSRVGPEGSTYTHELSQPLE